MRGRFSAYALAAGGLGLLLLPHLPAAGDPPADPPPVPAGVEVLARGPVHEGFARPVDGQPQPTPVVPKEPPPLVDEEPPDQKPQGDNVQWIPGYWQWDEDRQDFLWVSGFWRAPPPGRRWVPGHWAKGGDGWQWVGGFWAAADQDRVTYQPPPPDTLDAGPSTPPPDDDSLYVPGCWVWREARYRWRPGFFVACRPDLVWIPAHYVWTPCGCVFVDGYWDYPLADRGLLFAPCWFDRDVCCRPDFCFRPCYTVSCDFLPTALFVRPDCCHYYFGDYFAPRYERCGYTAWIDFRIGRCCHDPLFDYCRHTCGDRGWERDLRGLYAARFSGDAVRPPRTLVQQTTLINDVTVNKTVVVNNVSQVNVLTPLARAGRPSQPLEAVPRDARLEQRRNAERFREAVVQRHDLEREALKATTAPPSPGDPPRPVQLSLPKLPPPAVTKAPPPPPVVHRDPPPSLPVIKHEPSPPEVRHEPPPPVIKHDASPPVTHPEPPPPPVIKHEAPPPVIKHEAPPAPPPLIKPEPPAVRPPDPPAIPPSPSLGPMNKHEEGPPDIRRMAPPPPHKEAPAPPPPPVIKHDAPPPPSPPPPPPAPVIRHEAPPPPPPPPVIKHEAPPPPPARAAPPPPPPPPPAPVIRHEAPPPPPPPAHTAPPPPHAPPPPPPPAHPHKK
jgi:hypothetical protein